MNAYYETLLYGFLPKIFVLGCLSMLLPSVSIAQLQDADVCPIQAMETFTISNPDGDLCFTLETLEAIKQKLLEALKQKQPPENYVHLVRETERSKPMISKGDVRIGAWQLISRDNSLLLERQQMPRASRMLFFEAPLVWQDGQWQVLSVDVVRVKGR